MDLKKPQLIKLKATISDREEVLLFFAQSKDTAIASFDESVKVEEINPGIVDKLRASRPPSLAEISLFFSNLEKLTRTGISVIDSIKICIGSARTPKFRGALCDLYGAIKNEGLSLSEAIERTHPDTFGETAVSIIKSAEISGKLNEALCILVKSMNSSSKLQKQVKGALVYPIAMLVFSLLSLFVILLFVLPKMESTFESMGANLPPLTAFMLKMSGIMQSQTWILLILALALFGTIKFIKSRKDSAPIRYILSKTPIINDLQKEESLLKSFQVLSILLKTGSSLPDGHTIAVKVARLKEHKIFFDKIKTALEEGKSLTSAYQENQWMLGGRGKEIAQIVKIGETSNSLADILHALSGSLEESAAVKAEMLPKFIQPISTVLLFAVIGIMAASIYLPQFQLVMQIMER